MKKKPYDKSVYRAFALILQFGLNMLVPIGMMTALGIFLDKRLETSFWVIVLFSVGAIAGAQNSYRMAKHVLGSSKQDRKREQDVGDADHGKLKKDQ